MKRSFKLKIKNFITNAIKYLFDKQVGIRYDLVFEDFYDEWQKSGLYKRMNI